MSIPAWTFKNLCRNPSAVLVGDEFMGRRDAWLDVSSPHPQDAQALSTENGMGGGQEGKAGSS